MKRTFLAVFFAVTIAAPAYAEVVDKIVAVVGTDIVTKSDLDQVEKASGKKSDQILDEVIKNILLAQEIEKLGITANNDELASAIRGILRQNRMTIDALKDELVGKGIPFEQYKEQLRQEIKKSKFISQFIYPKMNVTDSELEHRLKEKRKDISNVSGEEREKLKQQVLEEKLREELDHYLKNVRERTYIEIFK